MNETLPSKIKLLSDIPLINNQKQKERQGASLRNKNKITNYLPLKKSPSCPLPSGKGKNLVKVASVSVYDRNAEEINMAPAVKNDFNIAINTHHHVGQRNIQILVASDTYSALSSDKASLQQLVTLDQTNMEESLDLSFSKLPEYEQHLASSSSAFHLSPTIKTKHADKFQKEISRANYLLNERSIRERFYVLKIQSIARKYIASKRVRAIIKQRRFETRRKLMKICVVIIQKYVRGYIIRRRIITGGILPTKKGHSPFLLFVLFYRLFFFIFNLFHFCRILQAFVKVFLSCVSRIDRR